jgi:hypothetical protein
MTLELFILYKMYGYGCRQILVDVSEEMFASFIVEEGFRVGRKKSLI